MIHKAKLKNAGLVFLLSGDRRSIWKIGFALED